MTRLLLAFAAVGLTSTDGLAQAVKRSDLKPGLLFISTDAANPASTTVRLEPAVAINLKAGETPHPRMAAADTLTWTGYIQVITPGKYTFDANLLGTLSATIDGKPVLAGEVKGAEAKLVKGVAVELEPGIRPFVATLTRADKAMRVELRWEGPGFVREPLPYFFYGHTAAQRPAEFLPAIQKDHGRMLFEEMACMKCHAAGPKTENLAKTFAERTGPNLSEIGKRAYPGWIDAWLADPAKLRPNTVMPKMFTADDKGTAERYAVASYLASLGGPLPQFEPKTIPNNQIRQSYTRGEKLYLTAGCATCHGPNLTSVPVKGKNDDPDLDKDPVPPEDTFHGFGAATGPQSNYLLMHVGSKTRPEPLAKFLEDPLATNPHGRMPKMMLSGAEATDIARFLCRQTDDKIPHALPAAPTVDPATLVGDGAALKGKPAAEQWKAAGKAIFTTKGCANCHAMKPEVKSLVTAPKLDALAGAVGKGCVSDAPDVAKVPVFKFAADQKAALNAFLKSELAGAGSPSLVFAARASLKRMGCLNCHAREGEGGIDDALANKMKQLENAQNADDVQPPKLTGVGGKLRTSWMREVLLNAGRARPWMTLRMPQYGPGNVGHLHEAIPALEGTTTDDAVGKAEFTQEKVTNGRLLAGKNGHGCISCHDISGVQGGGTRGPDLATTNQRVRYEWYDRWMHQPQRMIPGTRMPQILVNGQSLLKTVYGGDGEKQIESLWAYFSLGPGLPLPVGIEPSKGRVITVTDRAELLRTFMPDGAGAKAIAVGYPGSVSLAFDAAKTRVAYAWSGNFLDATPVWDNRGGAPAKLLGSKFLSPPDGPTWVLGGDTPPDFDKLAKDPAYGAGTSDGVMYLGPRAVRFEGYGLDAKGYPTFRYDITPDDGKTLLRVTDTPSPAAGALANGVTRAFTLEVPDGRSAWLNAGTAAKATRAYGPDGPLPALGDDGTLPADKTKLVLPLDGGKVLVLTAVGAPAGAKWVVTKTRAYLRVPGGKADFAVITWMLPKDEVALIRALK